MKAISGDEHVTCSYKYLFVATKGYYTTKMWWAGCCYVYGQCSRYLAKIGGRIPRDALSWFLAPKHQNRLSLHFLTDCALSWQSQIILHWVDGDNFASLTRNRDGRWRAVELFIPARGPSIPRDSDAGDELFFPFFSNYTVHQRHSQHTYSWQILKIDEIITSASLSMGTSPTTESTNTVKSWEIRSHGESNPGPEVLLRNSHVPWWITE
jgi:hypothetical protein